MDASKLVDSLTRTEQKDVFYELAGRLYPNTEIKGVTTPLRPWLTENRNRLTQRVFYALWNSDYSCVEAVKEENFTSWDRIGNSSWKQFKRVRGY